MKKAIVGVLIMLLLLLTSCSSNSINDDTSNTSISLGADTEDMKTKDDDNDYLEISDANRTQEYSFNDNRLILPYGRLDYFSYSNYQHAIMNIPEIKFYELINEIEASSFYDSISQFVDLNPSFSGGSNLGTIVSFMISNDECETKFSISADSNNKIFISIDDGNPENYQSYITVNDPLLEKIIDISGWNQVDPNQISVQKPATMYFKVEEIWNIKQGEAIEDTYYKLDATEFSLLLKQFSNEKKADGSEIMDRDAVIELYLEDGTVSYCIVDLYTGLLALEQQLYQFDDEFKSTFANIINTKK